MTDKKVGRAGEIATIAAFLAVGLLLWQGADQSWAKVPSLILMGLLGKAIAGV